MTLVGKKNLVKGDRRQLNTAENKFSIAGLTRLEIFFLLLFDKYVNAYIIKEEISRYFLSI
jgi:hypothetical protein